MNLSSSGRSLVFLWAFSLFCILLAIVSTYELSQYALNLITASCVMFAAGCVFLIFAEDRRN